MTKYRVLPVATSYWKPGTNYQWEIVKTVENKLADGDFVIISEKALSIAQGNIVDESIFTPSRNAKFIADWWMRICWGYILGVICHFGNRLLQRVRNYPVDAGSRHKQLALQYSGLLQTLMFGSEGGIDGSNLPYSYVSLPLGDAGYVAEKIRQRILLKLKRHVTVIIVDTDKTYSFRNFHIAPRPNPMRGIHSFGGVFSYVVCRMLKLRKRPTPLAVVGGNLEAEHALLIANVADRARGPGSGATVWDMASRFKAEVTEVSWEMLESVQHKPIVLVRKQADAKSSKPRRQ